jgi:hypothetical protein
MSREERSPEEYEQANRELQERFAHAEEIRRKCIEFLAEMDDLLSD